MDKTKKITTDSLEISYIENGSAEAPVLLLLHGWPDDATTWAQVAPALADAGYRTIAPYLRAFGDTKFRDMTIARTGDSGILTIDAINLMDALAIKEFVAIGHDWGSNIVESLAVVLPQRVKAIVQLSSPSRLGGVETPPFHLSQLLWYHWFQATKRGATAVRKDHKGFAKIMWDNWSPAGWYSKEEFEATAKSWTSPDWAEVTLHSYRARWDEAEPDPKGVKIQEAVKSTKSLNLPALYLQGEVDGVNPPEVSEKMHTKFSGSFKRLVLPGIGHFPTRESPELVTQSILEFLKEQNLQKISETEFAGK